MRDIVVLQCTDCKQKNYTTTRELKNGSKLSLKKYCRFCRKHQEHKEQKKK